MEQVRTSMGDVRAGRVPPRRLAVAIAVAVLLLIAMGLLIAGLFDGGPEFHDFHHG
jgi:hypothetical protein